MNYLVQQNNNRATKDVQPGTKQGQSGKRQGQPGTKQGQPGTKKGTARDSKRDRGIIGQTPTFSHSQGDNIQAKSLLSYVTGFVLIVFERELDTSCAAVNSE